MKIRNRIADIKTLQAHILQDYFHMALAASFNADTWKPLFRNEIQNGVKTKYSSYVGALDKMQSKGIDSYSIDDMDTTIITAILKYYKDNPFNCCGFYNINQYLGHLQDDRNIEAHATGNETDSELLQWAYGSLHNINKFVFAIANARDCTVTKDERNTYARKYQSKIESLRLQFENDYKEEFRAEEIEQSINRNIERIKTSKDPHRTYMEIERHYFNMRDNEGNRDFIMYNRFMQTAADAGIAWACSWIGDVYFEGLLTDVDYIKAAEYYEKGFSQLVPQQKLRIASIYLNDLCSSSHTKEEGLTIIKSCERPQWEIITYTSKEGYEFYSLKRNKHNY